MVDDTQLKIEEEKRKKDLEKEVGIDSGDKSSNVKALLDDPVNNLNLTTLKEKKPIKHILPPINIGVVDRYNEMEGNIQSDMEKQLTINQQKEARKREWRKTQKIDDLELQALVSDEKYMEMVDVWKESVLSFSSRLSTDNLLIQPTPKDFETLFNNQYYLNELAKVIDVDEADDFMELVNNQDLFSMELYNRTMIPLLNDIVKAELTQDEEDKYAIANYEKVDDERAKAMEAYIAENPELFEEEFFKLGVDRPMLGVGPIFSSYFGDIASNYRTMSTHEKLNTVDYLLSLKTWDYDFFLANVALGQEKAIDSWTLRSYGSTGPIFGGLLNILDYGVTHGGNWLFNGNKMTASESLENAVDVETKLSIFEGMVGTWESVAGFTSTFEGAVSVRNAAIVAAIAATKSPTLATGLGVGFSYHSGVSAINNYKNARIYLENGNIQMYNRLMGQMWGDAMFTGLILSGTYSHSVKQLVNRNGYMGTGNPAAYRFPLTDYAKNELNMNSSQNYPHLYDMIRDFRKPDGSRLTHKPGFMNSFKNKLWLDLGNVPKLLKKGTELIEEKGMGLSIKVINDKVDGKPKTEAKDGTFEGTKKGKETLGDKKPVVIDVKEGEKIEGIGDAITSEFTADGVVRLKIDPNKITNAEILEHIDTVLPKFYNNIAERLAGEGVFKQFNYENISDIYPQISKDGYIYYKLEMNQRNQTITDSKGNVHEIIDVEHSLVTNPKVTDAYFDFHTENENFNATTGAMRVFYHSTLKEGFTDLKAGESVSTIGLFDANGKIVEAPFVSFTTDAVSSVLFVKNQKIFSGEASELTFTKGAGGKYVPKTPSKDAIINTYPVTIHTKKGGGANFKNPKHIEAIIEGRGGEIWKKHVDEIWEYSNQKAEITRIKELLEGQPEVFYKDKSITKENIKDLETSLRAEVESIQMLRLEKGDWYVWEKLAPHIKELGFEGFWTTEGGFKSPNYHMFVDKNTKHKISSITDLEPYKDKKSDNLVNPKLEGEANIVHLYEGTSVIGKMVFKTLETIYKDLKTEDAKSFRHTGVLLLNEYKGFEKGETTKAGFLKYITDVLKIDKEKPEQVAVVRKIAGEYDAIVKNHAEALKLMEQEPTGEGGMPEGTVKSSKDADAYVSNFNLEKIPEAQRPYYEEVFRVIGENISAEARGGATWDKTTSAAMNPKYLQELIHKVLETEKIIMKDGKANPELRINDVDVVGAKLITSALVDVYKNNPTPENLVNLTKSINASGAIIATSGRSLQAGKIAIEVNHGLVSIDGMLREIGMADKKPGWLSKVVEWQRNMKLMSLSSVKNATIGNTAHYMLTVLDMPVSAVNDFILTNLAAPIRAAFYKVNGKPENPVVDYRSRRHSDQIEFFKGMYEGGPDAFKKAWALLKEDPEAVRLYSLYSREAFKYNNAIGVGWQGLYDKTGIDLGKAIRLPQRAQGAIDVVIREPAIRGFIYKYTNSKAINEGFVYGTKEHAARVKELRENPTAELLKEAQESAEYITFQKELGFIGKQLNLLRSGRFEGTQFVVPFFNTAANIAKTGVHRSPFGLFTKNYWDGVKLGLTEGYWGKMADNNAKIQTGTAIMYIMYQTLMDEESNWHIEGSWRNMSKEQRDFKLAQGLQSNSITFTNDDGSTWSWDYGTSEPVAAFFRMVAGANLGTDMRNALLYDPDADEWLTEDQLTWGQKASTNRAVKAGQSLVYDFLDLPMLKGVSDLESLARRLAEGEGMAAGYSYGTDFMRGALMPNFVAQTRKIFDPIYRDRPDDLWSAFVKEIPGITDYELPKLGLFGEAISHPSSDVLALFGFKITGNENLNYDAMYNQLAKIEMDKIPTISNEGWSKELTKEQIFLAKHIMGDYLAQQLGELMLLPDGSVNPDWDTMPVGVAKYLVASHYNAAKLMAKSHFIDNWIFDEVRDSKELIQTFKEYEVVVDGDMMKMAKKYVYQNFNEAKTKEIETDVKALKLKKEEEFYEKRENE